MSERNPQQESDDFDDDEFDVERAIESLDDLADLEALEGSDDFDFDEDLEKLAQMVKEGDFRALSDMHGSPVDEARRRISVEELLARMVRAGEELHLGDLLVLSGLSRAEEALVEAQWQSVPEQSRRRIIEALVEAADDVLELDLGRMLRIALRDPDEKVRTLAINGLWEDTQPDLIGPLVQILGREGGEELRAAAAQGLGIFVMMGELEELDTALSMRAEQVLLAVLSNPAEPVQVRCRALESIAFSSEAGLRQLLQDAYYSPEEEMRLSALRAMGRSADTHWRSMAMAELTSPEAEMRAEAARACGQLEARAALPQLLRLLADPEQDVRLAAIEALGNIGGRQARAALREIAADEEGEIDEAEIEAAEEALEEMLFWDEAGAEMGLNRDEPEDDDEEEYEDDDDLDEEMEGDLDEDEEGSDDDADDLDSVDPFSRGR